MKKALLPFLCSISLLCLSGPVLAFTAPFSGAAYCSVPAVPGAGFRPNVLLLLDNSLSMTDLAYDRGKHCTPAPATSCTSDANCGSGQICRDKACTYLTPTSCSSTSDCAGGQACTPDSRPFYCVDDSYRDDTSYSGYFDRKTIYRYDLSGTTFQVDAAAPLVKQASCSGSCAANTSYLYLEMAGTAPNRTLQSFKASGNFLNWLAMSKMDLAKQVLTGGKLDADGYLSAESRGCNGKRFVKLVPDAPQITFTVRGGDLVPGPYLFEWQPGPPGATVIEVFDKSYAKSSCLQVLQDWETALTGTTLRDHVFACLNQNLFEGTYIDPFNNVRQVPTQAQMYLWIRSVCLANSGKIDQPAAGQSFTDDCYVRGKTRTPLDQIKLHDGDDVCATRIAHDGLYHGGAFDNMGYVGRGSTGVSKSTAAAQYEANDYCLTLRSTTFTEPSITPARADSGGTIPPFITDAGIYGLGAAAGTMKARITTASPPLGLLQQFGVDINFGAMIFNGDGADGGRVIAPVGSAVGDHRSSGLVATLDGIATSSKSPLAESFYNAMGYFANNSDLKLQAADFSPPSPAQHSCQSNNVVIITDGISDPDKRSEVQNLVTKWVPVPTGSYHVDDLASLAKQQSLANFSAAPATLKDQLSTYVIYTGPPCGAYDGLGNCVATDEGVPEKLMQLTASKGGGKIFVPGSAADIESTLKGLLPDLAAGSGTDTTIVSTGDGNGALFLQERFYPSRSFEQGTTATWLGELQSLWYYIDPFLGDPSGAGSSIREDTTREDTTGKSFRLTLKGDRIVKFDPASNTTSATVDVNGDGRGGGASTPVTFDDVQSLWRAGKALWERDPATRQLKTSIDGRTLINLSGDNAKLLAPYLNLTESEAAKLIAWVLGSDQDGYRKRQVTITDPVSHVASTREWKLGDIVSSTPQVESPVPLGSYHLPPPRGYNDTTYAGFIRSSAYLGDKAGGVPPRGMVYVGANDGLLHAFNLGQLQTGWFDASTPADVKAQLSRDDLGKEVWGFLPKNVLPYLKYLADPSYRHLYLVDGKITLVDAKIGDGNTWRTVLIGGMGLGGASTTSCPAGGDCVATPNSNTGYSAYFALDVTDPANPSLLWEFSDSSLGYSTSGPAIVKTAEKWFAVFGSGPTGPIDNNHQFLGRSNQNLKFFAVELKAGAVLDGGVSIIDTGIGNAFAGTMIGAAIDTDKWNPNNKIDTDNCNPSDRTCLYSDDALYVGYTKDGSDGGVLRISTNGSTRPGEWKWSYLVQGVGAVTSGIARIQDRKNHKLWLYFGTGRHFFNLDDAGSRRALYGVTDPCYNFTNAAGVITRKDGLDPSCSERADVGRAGDVVTSIKDSWWRIDLFPATDGWGAERSVSTPTATAVGAVFFPTFQPSSDACLSGNSYLFQVGYASGAAPDTPLLQGKAVMPLSSGDTREGGLASGGRGAAVAGKAGSVRIISNSGLRPVKKIIHIQER